jgi:formylglycine-generating enzyme required for sulfatase activity
MPVTAFRPAEGAEPIPGYRLEALLGRGGFGEVWRASAPGGFHVALKFLAAEEAGAERELRALRTLQQLRDGHLLHLFGVWRVADCFVLAMELADRTLMDRLGECRAQGLSGVPRDELLRCFEQAARGLDYLNEPNHVLEVGGKPVAIQHADVKPQNLLLVGTACKVGDFGLLRCLGNSDSQKSRSMTPAYAPPEVFDGKPTRTSDQYSLAVSWCLLRGGRLPFEGGPLQLLHAHAELPPDLSMLPGAERPAAARALSKEAQDRWPSCAAFVEALRAAGEEAVPAGPVRFQQKQPTMPDSSWPISPSAPVTPLPPTEAEGGPERGGPRALLWLSLTVLLTAAVLLAVLWSGRPRGRPTEPDGPVTDNAKRAADPAKDKDGPGPAGPQKDKPYVNSLDMKFVRIEPGSFTMGSPDGTKPPGLPAEEGRYEGETPHRVTLTKGYHMSTTLVTRHQWQQVMGPEANPSKFKGKSVKEKRELPVDSVSWYDCVEFCIKLSEKEGRKPCYRLDRVKREGDRITSADVTFLPGGTGYRLPTEAEWEYACRAGTQTPFWFGDSITPRQANYNYNITETTAVTSFDPNPWGLYDMHGNLDQWCEDRYASYDEEDQRDPTRRQKAAHICVRRGGSWISLPRDCRAAYRGGSSPGDNFESHGCRVVLCLD